MSYVHVIMLIVLATVTLWLAWRRDWLGVTCVFLSQAPWWIGLWGFTWLGRQPFELNMITDLTTAFIFLWLFHTFKEKWLAVGAIVFASATVIDVWAGLPRGGDFPHYLFAHEVLHYAAIVTVVGRGYAEWIGRGAILGWRSIRGRLGLS